MGWPIGSAAWISSSPKTCSAIAMAKPWPDCGPKCRMRAGDDRPGANLHQAGANSQHAARSDRRGFGRRTAAIARRSAGRRAETVRATIESELGEPIEELFAEFDPRPLASASIGQVHAARLKTGEPVVVKVQHAGIEDRVRVDLDILAGLAMLAERIPEFQNYRPRATAAEFSGNCGASWISAAKSATCSSSPPILPTTRASAFPSPIPNCAPAAC